MKKKKNNSIIKSLIIIVAILAVIGFTTPMLLKNLKFGLDLQGGFEVLYEVKSIDDKKVTDEMLQNTYKTISKRIDVLGVSEPEITIEGDNKIRVQLAGVTDPAKARETLSSVANLTFRDTSNNLLMNSDVLNSGGAKVGQDEKGRPAVSLSVSDKEKFYNVTNKISQQKDNVIVIWLDYDGITSYENEKGKCGNGTSKCLSAASVSQGFSSDVIIQGNFTQEEVETLVNLINSGSLPTKLNEISSKTVSASFGENSLGLTAKAGLIGVGLIGLIMILLYHFSGLIASIGIVIYTFLTFLTFWLFGGVLTLPGIAALVIGIGMAVDSCVISFSRIKDELNEHIRLEGAYKKGNHNSFMAIFDSNLTTLLVALILFVFGESTVKGFATMLIISTIVTMLIMVLLTRFLLGLFVNTGLFDNNLNLFIGYKNKENKKSINFVGMNKTILVYVVVVLLIGISSLFINKLTLGIDFKGGSSISIVGEEKLNITDVKKEVKKLGYNIYDSEKIDNKTFNMKINESLGKSQVLELEEKLDNEFNAKTEIGVISNMVKKDLIKNAILAILLASVGIIIYISIRFRFSYAISGVLALVHDTLLIVFIFSLFKIEITSIFIAAILSIIGYSINDTIVIFDRIRENLNNKYNNKIKSEDTLKELVNESLTATLGRSIITTVTTLCPVISLILFGAHEIINFNIALLVGLIAGVFSSIFIACQIWFVIEKRNIGKPIKKKWYEEEDKVKEKIIKGVND